MNCIICNKEIKESKYTNNILCSSECFITDFWNQQVINKDDPKIVRIDGIQYKIGSENNTNSFRGYGGRKFRIKLLNGDIIETTNLWNNGIIPDSFKELLPDNAEFQEVVHEGRHQF